MNAGSVFIEIPLMLSSNSDEEKHIDLNNQGLFLAYEIAKLLRTHSSEGSALSELIFWGTVMPGTGDYVRRIDFNKDL
jgi:hypothetical protein